TFKFIASGSAAAALKLKSNESGAGRFTDFVLPPLTFREYLLLTGEEEYAEECFTKFFGKWDDVTEMKNGERLHLNMDKLNVFFIKYINYGGYPEVSLSETIQKDPQRYIRNDIIDKVLLRDLPSLYGIQDIQELNSLFTYIAYHSGNEMSLDEISKNSGVAKNTIKKYLTYLEAAFLIKIIHRVDNNLRKFKRAHYFKVYLINPSLRSALFSPITESDPFIGNMVETAIYSQLQHMGNSPLYYARWSKGEVDIVSFGIFSTPNWATEVKWSDKYPDNPSELKSLFQFCSMNRMKKAYVTTRSISQRTSLNGLEYEFIPSSLYCYSLGKSILWTRTNQNLFPDYGDVI
ncbi:MAG TPA: DUF4143 domain-containing protein, partial [Bacteroidia bacterium]|nr:DUF4143 domain-containing protein [Bacteroidia bacterium]